MTQSFYSLPVPKEKSNSVHIRVILPLSPLVHVQIAATMENMDRHTTEIASAVQQQEFATGETSGDADDVQSASHDVMQQSTHLQENVNTFLAKVAAA